MGEHISGPCSLLILRRDLSNIQIGGYTWEGDLSNGRWADAAYSAPDTYWSETGRNGSSFYLVVLEGSDSIVERLQNLLAQILWMTAGGQAPLPYNPDTPLPPDIPDSPYSPGPTEPPPSTPPLDAPVETRPTNKKIFIDGVSQTLLSNTYTVATTLPIELIIGGADGTVAIDEFIIGQYPKYTTNFTPEVQEEDEDVVRYVIDVEESSFSYTEEEYFQNKYYLDVTTFFGTVDSTELQSNNITEMYQDVEVKTAFYNTTVMEVSGVNYNDVEEVFTSEEETVGYESHTTINVVDTNETVDAVSMAINFQDVDVEEEFESSDSSVWAINEDTEDVIAESTPTNIVVNAVGGEADVVEQSTSVDEITVELSRQSIDIDEELPMLSGEMCSGATLTGTLPELVGDMSSWEDVLINSSEELPELTCEMCSGATLTGTLPELESAVTATVEGLIHIEQDLPMLEANVWVLVEIQVDISEVLPMIASEVLVIPEVRIAIAETFEALVAEMSGTVGIIGNITEALPSLEGTMVSGFGSHIHVAAAETLPTLEGLMTSEATVFETFCMNLRKTELVSKFTNFNFNSYAIINNVAIAASPSGLFALEGTEDVSSPIVAGITFPALNFGTYLPKKVYGFRLGGRFKGQLTLTVTNGVDTWTETIDFGTTERPQVGKGYYRHATRGEYLTFALTNPNGDPFTLNDINLYMQTLER